MPLYEYRCGECYSLWEELQKIGDETPFKCKSCNAEGTVERLPPGGMSFILKGGGWYKDGYTKVTAPTSNDEE